MAHVGPVYQWEIFWTDLEPHVGTEQADDSRPVIVVSNNGANAAFGTVTVVPLTKLEGKGRTPRLFEVALPRGTVPNAFTPLALPHQIRSISKHRLLKQAGKLTDIGARQLVQDAICEHLGIDLSA
jgi:mRNA-degrading endonuclease toxin of MazEF toxin-antitoxin module